ECIELWVDDARADSTGTASPATFALDTTQLANGAHLLVAKAIDGAGDIGASPAVSLTVANTTVGPHVAVTSPADGATVFGTVTLVAEAAAAQGTTLTSIELFADGVSIAQSAASPLNQGWVTTAPDD